MDLDDEELRATRNMKGLDRNKMELKEAVKYLKYMNENIDFNAIGYVYANDAIDAVNKALEEKEQEITRLNNIKNNCPATKTSGITCDLKEKKWN